VPISGVPAKSHAPRITITHPDGLGDEWPVWRLVIEGVASLPEIDAHWDLDDVYRANDALTIRAFADEHRGRVQWG
jgi:hypothetical protein